MRRFWIPFLFVAGLACAQTAKYPAEVVTDEHLTVARNRVQTRLRGAISPTATSISVLDGSRIEPNMLLTIGDEIVKVCAVNGNDLLVGHSACPHADGRGFDGTTPAFHLLGAQVSAYINAWHHNALAAEVKAIQDTLGPNLANIPENQAIARVEALEQTFVVSSRFDFEPQSPGGELIAGVNVITMSPVPRGVNGTNANHYLYVSGGDGTPEACLIVGGTGQAGDASGQIIIQCSGAHSGEWTIRSATAGIQEAIYSLSSMGGEVRVPAGDYPIWAEIRIDRPIRLVGDGMFASHLKAMTSTQNIVVVDFAYQIIIRDLAFATALAALPKTAGAAVILGQAVENRYSRIQNVRFYGQFIGVDSQNAILWIVDGCEFENNQSNGVGIRVSNNVIDAGSSIISNNYWAGGTGGYTGVQWKRANGLRVGPGNKFTHTDRGISIEGEATHGIATVAIFDNYFDNVAEVDIRIAAAENQWHSDVAITGNFFNGGQTKQVAGHINLYRARRITIAGNHFMSRNESSAAIQADTCFEVHIAGNGMMGPASGTSTAIVFTAVSNSSIVGNSLRGYVNKVVDDNPTQNYVEAFIGLTLGIGTSRPSSHLSFGDVAGRHLALWEGTGGANRYGIGMHGTGVWPADPYRTRLLANGAEMITITSNGRVGINKVAPGSVFAITGLPTYADNSAAVAAGLTAGDVYRTSTGAVQVVY